MASKKTADHDLQQQPKVLTMVPLEELLRKPLGVLL
jgi:hypothetical protein